MTTSQRDKQKRLEKKRASRKAAQNKQSRGGGQSGPFSSLRSVLAIPKSPIHECWLSTTILGSGMGTLAVSRRLANGNIAVGVFLLDVYCLGVKDCFLSVKSESEYDDLRSESEKRHAIENIHQTCARKIVEGAVDYANSLGFKPHAEYKKVKIIFGDVDGALCPASYEYGKDGKPLYISGPFDSPARRQRIVEQLHKVRGEGGYHFMLGGPSPDDDDDEASWL